MSTDPFATPAPVASEFASIASFRGRLVLVEPTDFERDVPNQAEPGKVSDRITATVTVIDGSGPVEIFSYGSGTGQFLKGTEFKGVWISQDRLVKQLTKDGERGRMLAMVLGRFETYKPGQRAVKGNPWGLLHPNDADKQTARDFIANRLMANVAGPAADEDPFG